MTSSPQPPTLEEYKAAAEASYRLTNNKGVTAWDFKPPEEFTIIKRSSPSKVAEGFSAVALQDKKGNVIITYEGTEVQTPGLDKNQTLLLNPYSSGSLGADASIIKNDKPRALDYAVEFARQVQKKVGKPVYVTGHSLGGTEAEAAAKALGSELIAGGVTFGATGLPGNRIKNEGNLINYVERGDPAGNLTSTDMEHYGKVVNLGKITDAAYLEGQKIFAAIGTFTSPVGADPLSTVLNLGKQAYNAQQGLYRYHDLSQYFKDLPKQRSDTAEPTNILQDVLKTMTSSTGPSTKFVAAKPQQDGQNIKR